MISNALELKGLAKFMIPWQALQWYLVTTLLWKVQWHHLT